MPSADVVNDYFADQMDPNSFSVGAGTTVTIIGNTYDPNWVKVSANGKEGQVPRSILGPVKDDGCCAGCAVM